MVDGTEDVAWDAEQKETLKLEAGKYYKTRDGRKVFVFGKNPFDSPYPFIGAINQEGTWCDCWDENGKYLIRNNDLSYSDLVSEWPEETVIDVWMGFNKTGPYAAISSENTRFIQIWPSARKVRQTWEGDRLVKLEVLNDE